jgi:hypothetical protein
VIVNSWDLKTLDLKPRLPEILSSSDAARAISLNLAAARASQTTRCTSARGLSCSTGGPGGDRGGGRTTGGVGLLVEFAPGERHEVTATAAARLLLLLTPWPGSGHPGAMTIRALRPPPRRQAGTVT